MQVSASPAILHFGSPVVLIATVNEDGSHNLAPTSSVIWLGWLGWRCIIGLAAGSMSTQSIRRTGECVLNLPSMIEVGVVDRLAPDRCRPLNAPRQAQPGRA